MGIIHKTFVMWSTILLFTFLTPIMAMQTNINNGTRSCDRCVMLNGGSSATAAYPWLFNKAPFQYSKTDSDGYPVYQFQNSYYIHFYDEGFWYDGFYVVSNSPTGYHEGTGWSFTYNSDSSYCLEQTSNDWYIWRSGDWYYDNSIYIVSC